MLRNTVLLYIYYIYIYIFFICISIITANRTFHSSENFFEICWNKLQIAKVELTFETNVEESLKLLSTLPYSLTHITGTSVRPITLPVACTACITMISASSVSEKRKIWKMCWAEGSLRNLCPNNQILNIPGFKFNLKTLHIKSILQSFLKGLYNNF